MTDKEKKSKIADIIMDAIEEYNINEINRPMIASVYAGDILSLIDSKEPVSDDLEDEYNNYIDIHDGEWTKDDYLAFARHFANWGSKHHKPIGEDFEKVVSDFLDQYTYPREEVDFLQFALYINSWAKEQISKHYHLNTQDLDIAAEKCEESWVKVGIEPQKKGDYVSIFKAGANWQKQQMIKNAIEREVLIDAGGYPYIDCNIELYDYDKDVPLAKKGDKVKIVVIKDS